MLNFTGKKYNSGQESCHFLVYKVGRFEKSLEKIDPCFPLTFYALSLFHTLPPFFSTLLLYKSLKILNEASAKEDKR